LGWRVVRRDVCAKIECMSEIWERSRLALLLRTAEQIHRELQTLDLTRYSDDEAVAALQANERLRRMQEPFDHALLLDIEQRGIPSRALARGTGWLVAVHCAGRHS
jgi:hypothetical protein